MQVVSVINYKGGVGKTTLTANLGAELARRGKKVLLIDLDPQASLTFSFYSQDDWRDNLAKTLTIKEWYQTANDMFDKVRLADLVSTPPRVNELVADTGSPGRLDLLASHLDLINIDLDLAAELGGGTFNRTQDNYLRIHGRLAKGLRTEDVGDYDVAMIDCAPNFNITTKTAIVASDHILVPSKADYLSTLGIDYLSRKVRELISDYNQFSRGVASTGPKATEMTEPALAVVFTMVQYYGGQPTSSLRPYMEQVRKLDTPVFSRMMRENNTLFASAPRDGVPAILTRRADQDILRELRLVVDEFTSWLDRTGG